MDTTVIDFSKLIVDEYYYAKCCGTWGPVKFIGYDGYFKKYLFSICGNEQSIFDYEIEGIIYKKISDLIDLNSQEVVIIKS